MSFTAESQAVAFVRAHMEAYSSKDLDTARGNVADDVEWHGNEQSTVGLEAYMEGLAAYVAMLEPGSMRVIGTSGDERHAMIMVEHTVGGQPFPSARTIELDENGKIKVERVVFFLPQSG